MCYHQAPPLARVVAHVGDAGQAKPHLEHNPLSRLGTCYATPIRKLNDPEIGVPMVDVPCFVGIDVAKAQLDIAVRPSGERWAIPNDAEGVVTLVERFTTWRVMLYV